MWTNRHCGQFYRTVTLLNHHMCVIKRWGIFFLINFFLCVNQLKDCPKFKFVLKGERPISWINQLVKIFHTVIWVWSTSFLCSNYIVVWYKFGIPISKLSGISITLLLTHPSLLPICKRLQQCSSLILKFYLSLYLSNA